MQTLRAAATLLANAGTLDGLTALVLPLGFTPPVRPLDTTLYDALGLALSSAASVIRGPGSQRALLVLPGNGPLSVRDAIVRIATGLARETPQVEWLVIAAERESAQLGIAAWSAERTRPHIAALIIERDRIVDSDAETFCALAASRGDVTTYTRWLTILGREGLSTRFYRALEQCVDGLARGHESPRRVNADDARSLALLQTTRLLFLAFLEAKGWLDGDRGFLARTYAGCVSARGNYHSRVLRPLFFGTLNTPPERRAARARAFGRIPFLNGGLFAPTPLERRHAAVQFSDEAFGNLFADCFERYRFTAQEDRTTWSEAAVDPEMLGRAFESLMAAGARHASGTYFTPQTLVAHLTETALVHALADPPALEAERVKALLDGEQATNGIARALRERSVSICVLDPACGSGAFLVYALERLADLVRRVGDERAVSAIRRQLLMRSIFGVDSNPTAVWLCELRLWLSVVIESHETDPNRVRPLPNLDRQVRIGNALSGGGFARGSDGSTALAVLRGGRKIATLRGRYARAVGPRKRTALRALEHAERVEAIAQVTRRLAVVSHERRELLATIRSPDLFGGRSLLAPNARERLVVLRRAGRELRREIAALQSGAALPFSFGTGFADVQAGGGFDVVLSNPPWVRQHAVPSALRARFRRDFRVARDAMWAHGARRARAGHGFAGQVDLAALFVERGLSLCRPNGILALLLQAKLWRVLAGGGVRSLLLERCDLLALEDWTGADRAFDATVYPSLLVARQRDPAVAPSAAPILDLELVH